MFCIFWDSMVYCHLNMNFYNRGIYDVRHIQRRSRSSHFVGYLSSLIWKEILAEEIYLAYVFHKRWTCKLRSLRCKSKQNSQYVESDIAIKCLHYYVANLLQLLQVLLSWCRDQDLYLEQIIFLAIARSSL